MKCIYVAKDGKIFDKRESAMEHEAEIDKYTSSREQRAKIRKNLVSKANKLEAKVEEYEERIDELRMSIDSIVNEVLALNAEDERELDEKGLDFILF